MGLMTSTMAQSEEPVNDMEEDVAEGETEATEEGDVSIPPELASEVIKALRNPSVKKAIVEAGQSNDPAAALTGLAYGMIEGLDEKAKGQIPPERMPDIAMGIVDMLSELAGGGDDLKAQVLKMLVEQSTKQAQQAISRQQKPAAQPAQPTMPMPQGVQ